VTRSGEHMVRANGVDLCLETFGDPGDAAILLIGGAASSMDWWHDGLCERLASAGRFVVRYDLRDTGRSVTYEPGKPDYGGADLVADALGLLDALDVARAHLTGISMGAWMALRIAFDHPERVGSLTLQSTSAGGEGLPPMSEELAAAFESPPPQPDWSDRAAVVDWVIEGNRPFTGSVTLDEPELRALVERIIDRTNDIASSQTNHWLLEDDDAEPVRLGEIAAPTLVLHGTEDPLFPFPHGEALARKIPGARLVALEGVGHEYPPPQAWELVAAEIVGHTS
jgi:pimeloyl-ACP methyl ester carboxylesterase